MNAVKPKPHTFAEMEAALVQARVGDTVSVLLTLGHKPTRYQVIDEDGDTLYLQGKNGAEPEIVVAAAEQTVWLTTGKRNRRVVQVWVGRQPEAEAMFNMLDKVEAAAEIERLQAELASTKAAIARQAEEINAAHRSEVKYHEIDRRAADLRAVLTTIESDRDTCRLALAQLYNVAHGHEPGTAPLPNDVNPSSVVIDVMAAMLWHSRAPERTPIRVPPLDTYRSAISKSLPERMQNEKSA